MTQLNLALSFSIAMLTAAPLFGWAQERSDPQQRITGVVEGGVGHAKVSEGFPNWDDQYLKFGLQFTASDRLAAEISHQSHFGDSGIFIGVGYTRIFDDRWYGSLNIGTSSAGFFLPRIRADAFVYRKWLKKKNLVTNIGFSYYRSRDVHFDFNAILGATYYFDAPWIVEAGVRLNESNPGTIFSTRGFVAVTFGNNKRYYFTIKYEGGKEAYQAIAVNTALVDFLSQEASFTWRQWITSSIGFNARVSYYDGPYQRLLVEIGLFYEFCDGPQ